ncbi:MAG: chalcone isomerase family protein [Gammaproteobacteria bacterium]|nr:chalcone isomerase family protein [Gammaproteobacteria bacterium]MDH5653737.1 chalcone isomerase family protein [Gammaproteobacteria bacterium]
MMHKLITLSLLLIPVNVSALEIVGVEIPEQVTLLDPGNRINLNGAGIRSKFVFNIYIGALYLKTQSSDVDTILNMKGQKRVMMHILYDEVSKEKLINGWNDGFSNNHSSEEFAKLQARLTQFNSLFTTVKKGDVITLDLLPDIGTEVRINEEIKGMIPGNDFYQALLKVWLGDSPADGTLKKAMLGIKDE